MRQMMTSHCVRGVGLGLLAVALALPMHAQTEDSPDINRLLSDARVHAWEAARDAETLQSYTMSKIGWETHASQLRMITGHVNDLGKVAAQLTDMRSQGSPWQQTAIDRINPLLRELADDTTTTIKHLSDHPNQVNMQQYRDYASASNDDADRIATLISDFVNYGKAKARTQRLADKLELPATSGSGDSQ